MPGGLAAAIGAIGGVAFAGINNNVSAEVTEGLAEAPMTIDPDDVGRIIVSALRKGRETVYAPGPLRVVMAGLKTLPRPVFRKLPL